jgi:hypothetical protein
MRLITLFKRDLWELERRSPEIAAALRATVAERLAHQAEDADPAVSA